MTFNSIKKIIFASLLVVLGFVAGASVKSLHALSDKIFAELETFTRIMEIVDKEYVDPIDEKSLVEGAINGMLSSLDPYTVYMPPKAYRDFKADTSGKFGGVGLEITIREGVLTVVSPIEGSPAALAGIKEGDRILKIDGAMTKNMTLIDASHAMRGSKGKKVVLTIWREGFAQSKDLVLTRALVESPNIKTEFNEGGLGYVKINTFFEDSALQLTRALGELENKNGPLKGLVIDLRNDPGGLLSEAVKISDMFIKDGPIVTTRDRHQKEDVQMATPGGRYENLPLVVLMNFGSASASEIVAGALQDTKRAQLVGTRSFGKGSVQTVLDLGRQAALKITIAKYYTPKNRSINGVGNTPDVLINQERLEKDFAKVDEKDRPTLEAYQKQKAFEVLKASKASQR